MSIRPGGPSKTVLDGTYSPLTIVNAKGLRRWTAAVADAGAAVVPLLTIGDSLTFGQGSDNVNTPSGSQHQYAWPAVLRRRFAAIFGSPGEGLIMAGPNAGVAPDARISVSGAVLNVATSPFGNGYKLDAGQTVTLAVPATDDDGNTVQSVDVVLYYVNGNPRATTAFNGGAAVSVNAGAGTNYYYTSNVATAGVAGNLVVAGTGTSAFLIGFILRTAKTAGVHVHRLAMCGRTTSDLLGTTPALGQGAPQQLRMQQSTYEWLTRQDTGVGVTSTSTTVTSTRANVSDIGKALVGPVGGAIPPGSTITGVVAGTSWTIDKTPTTTASGLTVTVGRPGLCTIEMGINDWQNEGTNAITPAVFKSNLLVYINQIVALGWCVLLIAPPQSPQAGSGTDSWATYVQQLKDIANATDHVAFWDVANALGTPTQMQSEGLYQFNGSVHLTRVGYGAQAVGLGDVLLKPYTISSPG